MCGGRGGWGFTDGNSIKKDVSECVDKVTLNFTYGIMEMLLLPFPPPPPLDHGAQSLHVAEIG